MMTKLEASAIGIHTFLQFCHTHTLKFSPAHLSIPADDADKICLCPCSRQTEKWRKQQGIVIDECDVCKTFKVCEPLGLMSHLKKVGELFVEKENRKIRQVPMLCKFHYGAYEFLRELFKDYNGGKLVHSYHFVQKCLFDHLNSCQLFILS